MHKARLAAALKTRQVAASPQKTSPRIRLRNHQPVKGIAAVTSDGHGEGEFVDGLAPSLQNSPPQAGRRRTFFMKAFS